MADQSDVAAPVEDTIEQAADSLKPLKADDVKEPKKGLDKSTEEPTQNLNRCLVYCRLRPANKTDFRGGGSNLVSVEGKDIALKGERRYAFDGTFDQDSTQEQIFDSVAVPCIEHAFNGFCSALMCYGQTGTGKSFTMCNTTPGNEGIIPRAARYIFEKLEASSGRNYEIVGRFVQIYRDNLGDLMVSSGKERVEVRFDDDEGIVFMGCTSRVLSTPQEFMQFYRTGNERRVVTATAMNPESSRGHTALMINISSEDPDDPAGGKMRGKITFIDLAGYERFSKTGITSDNPIMKDEAKCINASLLALGHVVTALSSGYQHIPWRDSKLTRILQDSIGGRSRTSIILTVGPSTDHLYETTNTLQFGLRAMSVKVSAKKSIVVNYEKLARNLQTLLDEKEEQIALLEVQIAGRDAERAELMERYNEQRAELDLRYEKDMAKLVAKNASPEQIQYLNEVYKVEVENLHEQRDEEIKYKEEVHSKEITKLVRQQAEQEAKRRAEMKLAQERIIEDFQKKLDDARQGKNEDIVDVLRQLTEKDSLLASRANDTARLHEHIEVLTEQIKEMGGTPVEEAVFPETFIDVGQVEEIQQQLGAELEWHREKEAQLYAEVERLSKISSDRVEEINKLHDENTQLRQYLTKSGVELSETDDVTKFLRERRARMVDSSEMETLRVTMQADLDESRAQNAELTREVERLKEERAQQSLPMTARIFGTARGSGGTARSSGGPGLGIPPLAPPLASGRGASQLRQYFLSADETRTAELASQADASKKAVKQLSDQLTFSIQEKNSLQERIRKLEEEMTANGLVVSQPYVPPIKLGASALPPAPSLAISSVPGVTPDADLDVLLKVKDAEVDEIMEVIERQQYLLTTARANDERYQHVINILQQLIDSAELPRPELQSIPSPVDSIAMDDYMNILRALRESERKMALHLIERDGKNSVGMEALLEEKDQELQLKDELVIGHASKMQFVAKVCIRLKNQLERLGIIPCCQLPDSYKELIEQERLEMEDQIRVQNDLEQQLLLEAEEKKRLTQVLRSMQDERERDSDVMRRVQQRCKEAQEKEMYASEALSRLTREKSVKEKVLEESMRTAAMEILECKMHLSEAKELENTRGVGRLLKLLFRR
ncbi:putative kinesin [Trypanosoma rangeli]|uniref:Putative kinesin n=1 Tax=Trypanosoma rangeli TaxID=5698 RepID=A0A3R7MU74_TRYRA|nr:putative kinesin [Trypanosoma rangeli]RNF11315.1 putative kinesin [Trypanosoma rangeli]|eukprot:RNF11315.1 putative kinesin [Trypanosoma rangeli]